MKSVRVMVTTLLVLAVPLTSRADVVPAGGFDKRECPPGTTHDGCWGHKQVCLPVACSADADCSDGLLCRELQYCERPSACDWDAPPDETTPRDLVDFCSSTQTCDPDLTCATHRVCASSGTLTGWRDDDDGCAAGPRVATPLALLLLALLVGWWRRAGRHDQKRRSFES